MSHRHELRVRIDAERKALQAKVARLRADGTAAANDAARVLEVKLKELEGHLRHGWDNVSEKVASKLNDWIDRSKSN